VSWSASHWGYEEGCDTPPSSVDWKSDLAPRMPTFDQGVHLSNVLERENESDHQLDPSVIHQFRHLGQDRSDGQRRGDQLWDNVRPDEELDVGTS